MKPPSIVYIVTMLFVLTSVSFAGNFEDAAKAANWGDYNKAQQLWLIEANNGNAAAQLNLGLMAEEGLGVAQDDKQAVKWYRMAAGQGEIRAQYFLGLMLESGRGVPQDYEEAIKWYTLSAEQGHVNAQFRLGLMYLKGLGVAQSPVNAYAWWIVAASQGHEDAQKYMTSAKQQMTPKEIENAQQIAKQLWSEFDK